MKYTQKSWEIVAYTFQADVMCWGCIVESLIGAGVLAPAARDMRVEDALDMAADAMGINREDERSFDSGEFPKVVFASDVLEGECCGVCKGEL